MSNDRRSPEPNPESDMISRLFRKILIASALLLAVGAEASTLEQAQKRGFLICGASNGLPGFAHQNEAGRWSGFDVDFCRALAAAIFDDPEKMRFVTLSAKDRVKALQSGVVDLLARGAAFTLSRDAGQGLSYTAISFFDGQGFLARKKSIAALRDLGGLSVCVQQGTPFELDLVDFHREGVKPIEPKLFPTFEEAAKAYSDAKCEALTADLSTLAAKRQELAAPAEHAILPELIDKEPLGPIVRQGDDQWFDIVRWTHFAMVDAEELGVTSANADEQLKSADPRVRRLLGVDGGRVDGLGLEADWAYRIVKHVGNYGEAFERNLGAGSPIGLERRLNALWTKGGLMYAPPVR
ncbi:amino acid ABC transporter substrate-binding protein [Methylosinus sp. C49]|uniref:amino acid ABC transporter substrate-binding protein n=1 Tax=Methylosinus sp. C49 TaxID=2699395 RepID=UPI001366BD20|nr:amino acid ABC transporter substrate-binding protein [Methylosinus sp. C49]BBU62520.1 amino acid ABC transporter substrate-binding protein [Methylosinus sp. C49]